MCECVWEREKEREGEKERVCVCVRAHVVVEVISLLDMNVIIPALTSFQVCLKKLQTSFVINRFFFCIRNPKAR